VGIVEGIINVVQEGRFRLAASNGRSALFQLSPEAPLEPQDLGPLASGAVPVRVTYSEMRDRGAALAHDITPATGADDVRMPVYFRRAE
jgi:hypothetical protein